MSTPNGSSFSWQWRSVLLLLAIAIIPACGSGGGGGAGTPALPSAPGVTVTQSGYVVSVFATAPAGSSKPDSIVHTGNSIYVAYQDKLNPDGTDPGMLFPEQGNNEICQYDLSGNLIRTITVQGHNDGLMLFDSNTLWAMSNEDSHPRLFTIDLLSGVATMHVPTVDPPIHGGGYDDMIMIDGIVYCSCSNPSNPGSTDPLVVKLSINGATNKFDATPVIASNFPATDVLAGGPPAPLSFVDPDSMAIAPNGDLMVDGQGTAPGGGNGSQLAFIHSPGVAGVQQTATVLTLTLGGNPWPVDDTRFAPSGNSFMLVTDTGANTIYRIDAPAGGFSTGSTSTVPFTGTAYCAAGGSVYSINLATGVLTPLAVGMNKPHGLRFVQTPSIPPAVTVMNSAYSISLFAQAPAGTTKPDSIVELGGNVFVGYQGQLNHDGTIPPNAFGSATPQGFAPVIEYDQTGKTLHTYNVKGHIDGLLAFAAPTADGSNLWVMANEDAKPVLTTIVTATGVQTEYQPAVAPTHGGGYDDIVNIGGTVYVSCSAPAAPGVGQIVGILTLNIGPKQFIVTPFVSGGSPITDAAAGGSISGGFAFTDVDSMEITSSGDLLVDGQGDAAIAIIPKAFLAAGPAPTAGPTLAVGAAGLTTIGAHAGFVTFVRPAGETLASPSSNVLTTVAAVQLNWTGIPTDPLGTATSRKLYLTTAGNTSVPFLAGTIPNNTATTFTTNLADGSLLTAGPTVPLLNTLLYGNPLPADDTRFAPAGAKFLLVTDTGSNQIYRIDAPGGFAAGSTATVPFTGTAYTAGAVGVMTTDLATGVATPIIFGMKAPHGLLFVQ